MEYKNITFDKKHLRNCLRTLKRYFLIEITEIYNNSLGVSQTNSWKGKLKDYSFTSYSENAFCVLELKIGNCELSFDIPYDSEVYYGDIRKREKYIIDYINSGPHCQYIFKRII